MVVYLLKTCHWPWHLYRTAFHASASSIKNMACCHWAASAQALALLQRSQARKNTLVDLDHYPISWTGTSRNTHIYIYMIYFKTPRFRCRIFWIFLLSFYRQDFKPGATPKNRLEDIVSKNTIHDVPKWSKMMIQQKQYSLIWNMFRLKCSIWKGFWGPFFYLYVRAE